MNQPTPLDKNSKISQELDWRLWVFESLSFPTLILRPDHTIVNANPKFLERFDVRLTEIVGQTCHDFFENSGKPCSSPECPLQTVVERGRGTSVLAQIGKGDEREYEDRVFSPILDGDGNVSYIIESIRDVTRIKTLEKELFEIKEFMVRVVESSASGIVAANRKGQIMLMNRAAKELFGYVGKSLDEIGTVEAIYPAGRARDIMKKLRDETLGGKGKLPSTKTTIVNATGEEIPVEMTAAIIYDDEGLEEVATMGIYNDQRERLAVEQKLKEAQLQLVQSEKMASLGQLAAGVAHEINNPLTGILFYASLIMERTDTDDPLKEEINFIIEDVNRCSQIVKSLLAYSRQTGSVRRIVHLNDLVDQSLTFIRDQKVFSHIRIVKETQNEMMMIEVDTNQLCQVLINLVMNAVDAMDGDGVLTLRTYRDKTAKKAFLEVSDTGCGISQDHLDKIFDPFFTTKKPGKGTGLGLSTAIGKITENGGSLTVKETGENGTTFLIALPLYQVSGDVKAD